MWDMLSGIGNLASMGWDIYQGINAQQSANDYANLSFGSSNQQALYASELWDRLAMNQWPIEDLQSEYAYEDLRLLRDLQEAQRDYGIYKGMQDIELAESLDPMINQAKTSLVTKLAEGEDVLADRMRSQTSADINQAFTQQRADDARRFSSYGINPNSGAMSNYMSQMGIAEALAQAGGRTDATWGAETEAMNRQGQAINYASGIPLSQQQAPASTTSTSSILGALGSGASNYANLAGNYEDLSSKYFTGAAYSGKNLYDLVAGEDK